MIDGPKASLWNTSVCRAALSTLQHMVCRHLDSIMLHTLNLYIFYDSCLPRTVSGKNCGAFQRENRETKMARERNEWRIKKRWQDDMREIERERDRDRERERERERELWFWHILPSSAKLDLTCCERWHQEHVGSRCQEKAEITENN